LLTFLASSSSSGQTPVAPLPLLVPRLRPLGIGASGERGRQHAECCECPSLRLPGGLSGQRNSCSGTTAVLLLGARSAQQVQWRLPRRGAAAVAAGSMHRRTPRASGALRLRAVARLLRLLRACGSIMAGGSVIAAAAAPRSRLRHRHPRNGRARQPAARRPWCPQIVRGRMWWRAGRGWLSFQQASPQGRLLNAAYGATMGGLRCLTRRMTKTAMSPSK
jgi:hypothetical protein